MRAQMQQSVMMIFTVLVIASLLYVGMLGLRTLTEMQEERTIRTFWADLDRSIATSQNPGAKRTISIDLPRGNAICFLNLEGSRTCDLADPTKETDYRKDLCEEIEEYLVIAGDREENIIVGSDLRHRITGFIIDTDPDVGYRCFSGSRIELQLLGQGGSTLIVPG